VSEAAQRISQLSAEKRALLERQLLARRAGAAARIPRRDDSGPAPLSFPQQRLWFLEQLAPGQPTYNAALAMRVRGGLDVGSLERALGAVIARHEALRTVFRLDADGAPRQVVLDHWVFAVDVCDLRTRPEAERERALEQQARAAARRPFDLERDLMLRVVVFVLGHDDHALLFVEHHIAFDGWSDAQLFRELAELMSADAQGREPQLDPLPIQYADWAVWQRRRLVAEEQRLVRFWRQALAGAPPRLDLPTDRPRPPVQTFAGAHQHFSLPTSVRDGVRELARAEGATPFMVLLAAAAAGLHRWSGHDDFVFGSPIANRDRAELEHLIGFFSNTFVLRVRTDGVPSFRELVGRARTMALGAYERQDLPFERLVQALEVARDPSVNPVFQVNFRVQSEPPAKLQLPGLAIEPFELDIGFARFDLAIEFQLRDDALSGYVEYSQALFDELTVRRLASCLTRLLADALQRPDTAIDDLAWDAPVDHSAIRGRRGG
jgi:hypothetical protein